VHAISTNGGYLLQTALLLTMLLNDYKMVISVTQLLVLLSIANLPPNVAEFVKSYYEKANEIQKALNRHLMVPSDFPSFENILDGVYITPPQLGEVQDAGYEEDLDVIINQFHSVFKDSHGKGNVSFLVSVKGKGYL
jgi:hypothetical protein